MGAKRSLDQVTTTTSPSKDNQVSKKLKTPTTLTSLPQELVDKIVNPFLPSSLRIQVHEYTNDEQNGDAIDKTTCAVQIPKDWRWALEFRELHSKCGAAVDDKLATIDTLHLDLANHPNDCRIWDREVDAPIEACTNAEQWDQIVKKKWFKRVIIDKDFEDGSLNPEDFGGQLRITLIEFDGIWVLESAEWEWTEEMKSRDDISKQATNQRHLILVGAIIWVLSKWAEDGLTAALLSKLQRCMATDLTHLAHQLWAQGPDKDIVLMDSADEVKFLWHSIASAA